MTKTHLILTGLTGSLFLISCEPIPAGPQPRYGQDRYPRYYDRPEPAPYQTPDDRYGPDRQLPPEPQPAPQPTRDQYPTAERTNNPDQVLSPYSPYNVIDVQGFRSGQLAKDPSNGKIFRIP